MPAVEPRQTSTRSASLEAVPLDAADHPAGERAELAAELLEDGEGAFDRGGLLAAQLVVVVGHRERALGGRVGKVEEGVGDAVLADEVAHLLVLEQQHGLGGVGDREAVDADDHGQEHVRVLGQTRRKDGQVVGLLRALGEELDRAGVADQHRVGVVAVDVDRAGQRAVAERHHDRRAHRGGDVDDLGHQREALGRGRGHRPRAGERAAAIAALIAECSDSTLIISPWALPSAIAFA